MASLDTRVRRRLDNLRNGRRVNTSLRELEQMGDDAVRPLAEHAARWPYVNAATVGLAHLYARTRSDAAKAALLDLGEHPDDAVRQMVNLTLWQYQLGMEEC